MHIGERHERSTLHDGQEGRTLDIHECAQLDLRRVVVLPVHRRRAEDEVEQRAVVYLLDLGLRPVVAGRRHVYRRGCSSGRDVRCEPAGEPQRGESRRSRAKHGGVR